MPRRPSRRSPRSRGRSPASRTASRPCAGIPPSCCARGILACVKTPTINSERLWSSLMELARIGATPKGGVRRVTLTAADREGRELFARWCREAGLELRVDAIGNLFARRKGADAAAPPVVMGSHLDTQPNGGKFDGAYGVIAGLEVVRALNDAGVKTRAPLEVASWTNEEGSRFVPTMMGSGVFTGVYSLDRKSTRLNSSHGYISYAVFCLKKKKNHETKI